jgi:hypothetical protein
VTRARRSPSLAASFAVFALLTLAASCGGKTDASSQANANGSSNGGSASQDGNGGSSSSSQSPPANVTPSAPALQQPIAADAPCTVTPGAPTLVFPGHPAAFAIDGSFIYSYDYSGTDATFSRVPIAGGTPETVATLSRDVGVLSFALGSGFIYAQTNANAGPSALAKTPVKGDAFIGPTFDARTTIYATVAFDGLNVYSGQIFAPLIQRWPVDGSPEVDTMLPTGAGVQAIVAAPDAAYVALLSGGSSGVPATGSIAKVPLDGSGLVVIAKDVGEPTAIGVDDKYVYYAATRGGLETGGLYRIGFDGSGQTTLSEPSPMAFAVDAHSIFFLRNSLIYKVDKIAGGTVTKIGASQQFGGVLVSGGNVYWGAPDDGFQVAAGVWTACK